MHLFKSPNKSSQAVPQSGQTDQRTYLTDEDVALCAWCLAEFGQPMGEGSHGICPRHAVIAQEQLRLARANRHARGGR